MATDITLGAGTTTSPVPAVQFLRDNGVEVVLDNILNTLAIQAVSKTHKREMILVIYYYHDFRYHIKNALTLVTSACFSVGETSEGGGIRPPSFLGH